MALEIKLQTDQMMVAAAAGADGLDIRFADGFEGILAWTHIPGISLANVSALEFANPWVLNIHLTSGQIEEVPSDFLRYHLDAKFRQSQQK